MMVPTGTPSFPESELDCAEELWEIETEVKVAALAMGPLWVVSRITLVSDGTVEIMPPESVPELPSD